MVEARLKEFAVDAAAPVGPNGAPVVGAAPNGQVFSIFNPLKKNPCDDACCDDETINRRTGNVVRIKQVLVNYKLTLRAHSVSQTSAVGPTTARVLLLHDSCPNQMLPEVPHILRSAHPFSSFTERAQSRFTVLADNLHQLPGTGPGCCPIAIVGKIELCDLDLLTVFCGSQKKMIGEHPTNIQSGSLLLATVGTGVVGPPDSRSDLVFHSLVLFVDEC